MRRLLPHKSRSSSRNNSRTSSDSHGPASAPASASGPSTTQPQATEDLETLEKLGLSLLSSPEGNATLIDIVAVHGLNGHPRRTWTSENGRLWLTDFLPTELPYARIFSFGYDSQLTFSKSVATVKDFALGLLDELDNARTQSAEKQRPLVLIGHSLGGIVIKKAIILALEQQHRYGDILACTRGLVFLGTPHKGAELARWTRYSRDIINIAPFGSSVVRKTLLKDLDANSKMLEGISYSFQHRALTLKVASFYECVFTMPMKSLVVDKDSAVLGYPGEEALPMDADHTDICKIPSMDSQQWRSLIGAIKRQLIGLDLDRKYAEAQTLSSKLSVKIPSEIEERINILLDPIQFNAEIEQRVEFEMCPNTASWVLTNDNYIKWRREEKCAVLWIHGSPGSGKSFLTSFVFNQLSTSSFLGHSGVAYFACDRILRHKARYTASALYNSVIAQLLLQLAARDEGAVCRILADLEACQAIGQYTTPFRLWKNLQLATNPFKSCFILIDGLDENKEWQDVLALLKRVVSEGQGRLRLLVSSQSSDTIRELIHNGDQDAAAVIQLTEDLMVSDIKAFVAWKIKDLDTRDLGGKQNVLEGLVTGAGGLMLLAKYRSEALLRQTRAGKTDLDHVLKTLPQEVKQYYSQSITRIDDLPSQDREVVIEIFVWVTFAARNLTFQELSEALLFRRVSHIASKVPIITRSSLDSLCQGLIILCKDAVGVPHGSVLHYLLEEGLPRMTDSYRQKHRDFERSTVEAEIAGVLLAYLCSCPNPDLEHGKTWSRADLQNYPLLGYALDCWPHHTFAAKRVVPRAFEEFMQSPQHRHWWQCFSRAFGSTTYSNLQALFHAWLDSLQSAEAQKIVDIAGPVLPLRMLEEKLEMLEARPRENHEPILHTLIKLSTSYIENNRWNAGLIAGERVLIMIPELTERTKTIYGVLARICGMKGDRVKEVEIKEKLLNFMRSHYGRHHAETIFALDNLALGRNHLGQHRAADELSLEALKLAKNLFGEDHPETVQVMANRAVILYDAGQLDEALPIAITASEMMTLTLGSGHKHAIVTKSTLAQIFYSRGEEDKGRKLRLESFTLALVSLGHDHQTTQEIYFALEEEFLRRDDFKALVALRGHKMSHYVEIYGEEDVRTLEMMNKMLLVYMCGQDWESARTMGERLVDRLHHQKYDIDEGRFWGATIRKLVKVYESLCEYEKGISLGEETLSFLLQTNSLEDEFGFAAVRRLSRMYHQVKDWPNAVRCGSLAVEIATNGYGKDSEEALFSKRELAIAYCEAKCPQAGFDLYHEVFKTCIRIYGAVHPTTVEALLTICNAISRCEQKDLVLHFYELLIYTQRISDETRGPNHSSSADIQIGLDEIFGGVPVEWHPDMLAIQTKDPPTTSPFHTSQIRPIDEAQAGNALELPNGPETEDQINQRMNSENSAEFGVRLAYINASLHHFNMQISEIEDGAIWEDLAEEDPIVEGSADLPVAGEEIP